MNEEQYRSLCEACDRVLLAPDSTIERVAIPWLHVIREHPVFLVNYKDLFEPVHGVKVIVRQWWRTVRNKAPWLRQFGRDLRSAGQPWFGPENLPREVDILFVSHLLNAPKTVETEDFYFGDIPNQLALHGHSAVIVLINHSNLPAELFVSNWKGSIVPRIILSNSLGVLEESVLQRRLRKESVRLKKLAKKEPAGFFRRVLLRAAQEALSGSSKQTLRMAKQFGLLATKLNPKVIIVTHEGHAWERVAFAAVRDTLPKVYCIGYQHAAVFRLQHAIRRSLESKYNPDQILTPGAISKVQLECATGLSGIPICVLGSNRSNKYAAKKNSLQDQKKTGHLDNLSCLVIPEGIVRECHLLFEFSSACAKTYPRIQFIWRLHPVVDYKLLEAQNSKLRNLPRNIVLSKATLEEDIERSRWALYRGSTAIVQAVMAGLLPIYLMLSNELTIDPLYELVGWRTWITSIIDFGHIITKERTTNTSFSIAEMEKAKKYCEKIFLPFDWRVASNIIVSRQYHR